MGGTAQLPETLLTDRYLLAGITALVHLSAGHPHLIVLCIMLAIIVNRKLPGINAFRAIYYIPVISGSIAVGIAWRLMLDTNGIIKRLTASHWDYRHADPVAGRTVSDPADCHAVDDLAGAGILHDDLPCRAAKHYRRAVRRRRDRWL